ncbi:hypothetical protein [Algoriphagus namhaensis]
MRIGNLKAISSHTLSSILSRASTGEIHWSYSFRRHRLELFHAEESLGKIYLPIDQTFDESGRLTPIPDFCLAVLCIKAGQAVTGLFRQGELIDHKVFRAYMVRKKQGKSQVKHLKTKGKSRAGSRIRLEETERFFEEINSRLAFYAEYPIDRWAYSSGKTLWPYLFSSETSPPFSKDQDELYRIPFHLSSATFDQLGIIYQSLTSIHAGLSEEGERFLASSFTPKEVSDDEDAGEDW